MESSPDDAAVLLLPDLAAHVNSVEMLGVPTKVFLFYTLRLVLAVASTLAEVRFVTAATRALHRTLGAYTMFFMQL